MTVSMMRNGKRTTTAVLGLVAIAAGVIASPSRAHHSFAMYDQQQMKTLTGKLTRFIPGANHAQLVFELVDADGNPERNADGGPLIWGAEMGSAAQIAAEGVTVKAFPEGTILTVTINPLRDGRPFGAQARGTALIKCGTEMPQDGCTEQTGEVFLDD